MRKWYHGRGQGGPFKGGSKPLVAPPPMRREDILNRYEQHVKHCPSCSKVRYCTAAQHAGLNVHRMSISHSHHTSVLLIGCGEICLAKHAVPVLLFAVPQRTCLTDSGIVQSQCLSVNSKAITVCGRGGNAAQCLTSDCCSTCVFCHKQSCQICTATFGSPLSAP